jgi:hypothetical protein
MKAVPCLRAKEMRAEFPDIVFIRLLVPRHCLSEPSTKVQPYLHTYTKRSSLLLKKSFQAVGARPTSASNS